MLKEMFDALKRVLGERQYAYRATFKGPLAQVVLKDLARFCHAHRSTFHENDRAQSMLDGRREVWLRIAHHLQLSPAELWQLYDGRGEE
jgi:hypothetical protein